ncbi:hypothetical protein Vretifemale_16406 [Volvox reticuliferus]|uniref:Fungal lipase-type domain-containing protein n=1 Tax=Volvox reticuliferus TaxID=1737510 RepID=A0A8J4FSH2_9CHLO|nr:hypothetical protein Vretifemale_16406 [Volvox reticuliferus]
MASLRAPHSWQPGLQLNPRDGGAADPSGGRPGVLLVYRRHNFARTATQRRGRRFRTNIRPYGNVLTAIQTTGISGSHAGVGDSLAETIDVSNGPLSQACKLLRLEGAGELQDLIASLILSECVYKKLELDEEGVAAKVSEIVSGFPPGWVQLQAVQLSLAGIPQHYLIATSPTSMYVAFMGTKQFQDILADANLLYTPIWAESARLAADRQSIPAAHRGFLERARAIHVEQLYELAVSRGLRLVLCGHSLGGAVAKLCTLRLLRELPDWPRPRVRCIAFATPAVGNAALAELVENAGWANHFSTYYLPEDQLVRLISFSQARTTQSTAGGSRNSSGGGGGRANAGGSVGWRSGGRMSSGGARSSSSARTERRRRAKGGAGSCGGTSAGTRSGSASTSMAEAAATEEEEEEEQGGLVGSPSRPLESAPASAHAGDPRLDEVALKGLATGRAGTTTARVRHLQSPPEAQVGEGLLRVSSASSIVSASSCISEETIDSSSTGSVGSSSSFLRYSNSSFGDAQSEARKVLSSLVSPSYGTIGCASSTTSFDGEGEGEGGGSSLTGYLSPHMRLPSPPTPSQPSADAYQAGGSPAGWSAASGPATSGSSQAGSASGSIKLRLSESLDDDHTGVAIAMEEILAPGPDELEAAAAAGVALSGQPPMDLAEAQRKALYGNAGGSWGLRLALGRKRVLRRLRQLAKKAHIPLPKALLPVSRYHTFGGQWFVTADGALSPEELERLQTRPPMGGQQQQQQQQQPAQQQQQQQVTAAVSGLGTSGGSTSGGSQPPEGARGFFSFHRMVAYRQRHAELMSRLVRAAEEPEAFERRGGGALAPPSALTSQQQLQEEEGKDGRDGLMLLHTSAGTIATAAAAPTTTAASGVSASPYGTVQLSDSLLPRISVQRAVLRGVMPAAPIASASAASATARQAELKRAHVKSTTDAGQLETEHDSGTGNRSLGSSGGGGGGGMLPPPLQPSSPTPRSLTSRAPSVMAPAVLGHFFGWIRRGGAGGSGAYRSGVSSAGGVSVGLSDELVRLDLELEGHNLQYCRKVSVTLVYNGVDASTVANSAVVNTPAAAAGAASPGAPDSDVDKAAAAVGDGKAALLGGWGLTRWPPLAAATSRGGSSSIVTSDGIGCSNVGAVAAGLTDRPCGVRGHKQAGVDNAIPSSLPLSSPAPLPSPFPASSPLSRSQSTKPHAPTVAAASSAGSFPATEVPCEVVQVLYAQPYSDEANPPPLHPVSLFRNTLHHLARSLMGRCQVFPGRTHGQAQGQAFVAGGGSGIAKAASASAASILTLAAADRSDTGLAGMTDGFVGGRIGPWRRLRFQPNQRPTSNATVVTNAKGASGRGSVGGRLTDEGECGDATLFRPTAADSFLGGGDAAAAIAAAVGTHAVDAMPSRLMLRVTLPQSVARGLLDGTLPARLMVSVRSDFHALSDVPAIVQRPRVAIIGTSPYAASLVQAVLSAPAVLAAASIDGRSGAAGAAAGVPATGLAAWVPPPVAWALAAVRWQPRGPSRAVAATAGATTATASARFAAATVATTAQNAPQVASAWRQPTTASVVRMDDSAAAAPSSISQRSHPAPWTFFNSSSSSSTRSRTAAGVSSVRLVSTSTAKAAGAVVTPPARDRFVHAGGQPGGILPSWWVHFAAQAGVPRFRLRLGKLRWGIRQSLAAAAVGAAAASAAGVTGAAAAVGAAAVVASTVAAFSSDGGASVFANAAVTVAAVVAAAAAAATAFTGSEAAVVVAAAASAAVVAMAVATSSGPGVVSGPPLQQQQQQPQQQGLSAGKAITPSTGAGVEAAAGSTSSHVLRAAISGLPVSVLAPRSGPARSRTTTSSSSPTTVVEATSVPAEAAVANTTAVAVPRGTAAAAAVPRWILRFGAPSATRQPGVRSLQTRSGGGGGRATAGGAVHPMGHRWVLWWPGVPSPAGDSGVAAAAAAAPARQPLLTSTGRWFSWPLPRGGHLPSAPIATNGGTAVGAASLAAASPEGHSGLVAAVVAGTGLAPTAAADTTAATVTATSSATAKATPLAPQPPAPVASTEVRRRSVGWFLPLGGSQRHVAAAVADTAAATASAGGSSGQPVRGGVSLAQVLGSLRAGSGRAALQLPPAVLSDGLELCNVMVEPASQFWSPGRAGAAAAGRHILPLRPRRAGTPPAAAAPAPRPVPAAYLWKGRCLGPSTGMEPVAAATAATATIPAAETSTAAATAVAPVGIDPWAAAGVARAAFDSAAAAAVTLGFMPAWDGCPDLVGVAPFVAVRRMEKGLRRQVLQRNIGWRALLGGVVGALLRPVALVGMLGRLPGWGLQVLRRGHSANVGRSPQSGTGADSLQIDRPAVACGNGSAAPGLLVHSVCSGSGKDSSCQRLGNEWGVVVVAASCRDPLRVLRGRDMEALRNRAAEAGCPLVPVLLTCVESPPGRRAAAIRTLAAACSVPPGEVRVVWLDGPLLHQPAAAISRADLTVVWRDTAGCDGAAELRETVRQAAAAALQAEIHELQPQQ